MNMNDIDKTINALAVDWQVPVSLLLGESVNNDANDSAIYANAINNFSNGIEELEAKMIELGINLDL